MQVNETWAQIQHPNLKNYYYASSLGEVKSVRPQKEEKILKQFKIKTGYLTVNLSRIDGDNRPFFAHRAVMIAFYGMPDNDNMQVNHKNGVKTDNRIENLEWVTREQNIEHAIKIGLIPINTENGWIGDVKNIYKNNTPVLQIMNGVIVNRFSSQTEAALKNKIFQSGINHCIKGRMRTYKGCVWEYEKTKWK